MDKGDEVLLEQEDSRSTKSGRGVRQGRCLSPIPLNLRIQRIAVADIPVRAPLFIATEH